MSLRRIARREKDKLAVENKFARFRRTRLRAMARSFGDEFSFVLLAPLALGVAFLPINFQFHAFADPNRARDFLNAAWQVQGAALGLSLAVVLFVFQSVYGRQLGGSLRDFAEETWLFPVIYIGMLGLLLDGVVLLNGGTGAPGGWAATWAAIWAAAGGVSLPALFVTTIRAIEADSLQRMRLRRANRQIANETEDVIFRRIAQVILNRFCEQNNVEFVSVFGQRPSKTAQALTAVKAGAVKDIRLRRLRKLGNEARMRRLAKPLLRVEIGASTRPGSELLWVEPALLDGVRNLSRAFKIRERDEQSFRRTLDELHDQAVRAIATPSPANYAEIASIYEGMFLVLPETWALYGQRYVAGIADQGNPFTFGFTDLLERNLYEEMEKAAAGSSRDIAHDSLDLPIQVATRALELRALALCGRMLLLWGAGQRSVMRQPESEQRDALLSWARLRLHEYSIYPESLVTSEDSDDDSREFGKDVLLQTFDTIALLAKESLDVDRSDTETLADLNHYWDDSLQFWNPEHDDPQGWHLEYAVQQSAPEAELQKLREGIARNEKRVAIKREIDDWRALHRFGLLFWIMRNVRDKDDGVSWLDAWGSFAGYFGDVARLARVLDKGIEADFNDRGKWSNWALDMRRTRGAFAGPAIDLEFIQTFIVRALSLVSPDGPPPGIEPLIHGRGRLDNPAEFVQSVMSNENLKPLLPDDRLDDRAAMLISALETMNKNRRKREQESLIAAPIDDERVKEFADELRDSWRSHLLVRAISNELDVLESRDGEPSSPTGAQVDRWTLKSIFVGEPNRIGAGGLAQDTGRSLADFEMHHLLEKADPSPIQEPEAAAGPEEVLRGAISSLRAEGFEPSLVVVPSDWQLSTQLQLDLSVRRGGNVEPPPWLPDEHHGAFLGSIEGVPVLDHYGDKQDRIYVLDLAKLGRFRAWRVDEEANGVRVQVIPYDAEAAMKFVRDNPNLFKDEELTEDEKAAEVQQNVRLRVVAPFEFVVLEPRAARVIEVPVGGDELAAEA